MKRQRTDIGRVAVSPIEEIVGQMITTYDTTTGELSVQILAGELVLEITLEEIETIDFLHSNKLIYDLLTS